MTWQSPRMQELRRQQEQAMLIRIRIERRYARLRSFSPAMRRAFAERDIAAALQACGLPVPVTLSFDELVKRHLDWARRDAGHVKHISDMPVRRAVIAALEAE